MTYTKKWFNGVKGNFEKHLLPLSGLSNLKFLEIGTFEGMAAVWMFQHILTSNNSYLTIVDPFAYLGVGDKTLKFDEVRKNFNENITPYKQKLILYEMTSEQAWPKLLHANHRYDVIYIDGSHKTSDVLMDAVCAWMLLRKDGILIFDDYHWGGANPPYVRPKPAIDSFTFAYQDQLTILEKNNQVVIKKNI